MYLLSIEGHVVTGGGKIVNASSGRSGTPDRLRCSASKVGGLARSLAREVGPRGVNAPGFTLSDTQVASSGDCARTDAPPEASIGTRRISRAR